MEQFTEDFANLEEEDEGETFVLVLVINALCSHFCFALVFSHVLLSTPFRGVHRLLDQVENHCNLISPLGNSCPMLKTNERYRDLTSK